DHTAEVIESRANVDWMPRGLGYVAGAVLVAGCGNDPGVTGDVIAASCEQPDVQAAIDQASDGHVVGGPAGTCTWHASVDIGSYSFATKSSTTTSLVLRGAGIGKTIIFDAVTTPDPDTSENGLSLAIQAGKQIRITGFTFDGSSTAVSNATIAISG